MSKKKKQPSQPLPLPEETDPGEHPNHPLWNSFCEYAEQDGISLDHIDDWNPWWQCFLAGAQASTQNLDRYS